MRKIEDHSNLAARQAMAASSRQRAEIASLLKELVRVEEVAESPLHELYELALTHVTFGSL
jgi:hypothetical protein